VTFCDARRGERRIVLVRVEGGVAYGLDGRRGLVDTGWRLDDRRGWIFPDMPGQRSSVRRLNPGPTSRDGSPSRPLAIRVSDRERQRWTEAARRAGLDLSAWLRAAAEKMAEEMTEGTTERVAEDRTTTMDSARSSRSTRSKR